eukprot:29797-Pelagococcus_subviridis.AAC.17
MLAGELRDGDAPPPRRASRVIPSARRPRSHARAKGEDGGERRGAAERPAAASVRPRGRRRFRFVVFRRRRRRRRVVVVVVVVVVVALRIPARGEVPQNVRRHPVRVSDPEVAIRGEPRRHRRRRSARRRRVPPRVLLVVLLVVAREDADLEVSQLPPRLVRVNLLELRGRVLPEHPRDRERGAHLPRVVEPRVRRRERRDVVDASVHRYPPVAQRAMRRHLAHRELPPRRARGLGGEGLELGDDARVRGEVLPGRRERGRLRGGGRRHRRGAPRWRAPRSDGVLCVGPRSTQLKRDFAFEKL